MENMVPLEGKQQGAGEQEVPPVPVQPGGTVLIVEDDEYIAELLRYSFHKQGFTPLMAHDGLTAFDMVEEHRPDVILLDLMLPKLDGRSVCRLVREHVDQAIAATPIIMLTALSSTEDQAKGLALGANLYITKPYSVRDVVRATRQFLGQRQASH